MEVQLTWDDPVTAEQQQHIFPLPVAFGRELSKMPTSLDGQPVSQVVLFDANNKISRSHALLAFVSGQLTVEDLSANGTSVNGQQFQRERRPLNSGDTLSIGNYNITVTLLQQGDPNATQVTSSNFTVLNPPIKSIPAAEVEKGESRISTIIFNPDSDILQSQATRPPQSATPQSSFPPPEFLAADSVAVSQLPTTLMKRTDYLAIGGGMGSFVWVDNLRISGVKKEQIAVLSLQQKPYGRYETLLSNCQIYRYKRIRSGSDSCPDNIWGWPGYALRDAWRAFFAGQVGSALEYLWQVFSEPVFADTYTPRAGDVFASMDREAKRIGWDDMLIYGSIRNIRKTDNGQYIIAYSATRQDGPPDRGYLLAKYVHLCTGYPAIKLLDDLQAYRVKYGDLKSVVHGYEKHDHVYDYLEQNGGTVVIRGSGIVASQILDRLYQARKKNPRIAINHLNRASRDGQKFGWAKRSVENQWEFQPFNWPKGTWGGDMRKMLEAADPLRRRELLEAWGGTTTASRREWRRIVNEGLKEGWYTITFGTVERVDRNAQGKPVTYVKTKQAENKIDAEFIIDCTGLVSDPREHPLLNDLITHYNLDLNPQKRLHVENDFEIQKMRNDRARMYAAGIITLGGPYAPVDTFLGLQYAAHRSAEALVRAKAPGIHYLEGLGSLWQWIKWATNQAP
ncbi:FHA domain-containing protein [Kamptonema formosum]|uniref:FHA domain-containing protein n=1 Tax=Kamptonema formosum TaxID=331992 RepID=UPI00034684EF|nr:FHA domain-containing protein [Oscillatoria sp. PCC 10802]